MIYDITYSINEELAIYPGDPQFSIRRQSDINNGNAATVSELMLGAHTGTHIDAPMHFLKTGGGVNSIPLEKVCGRARVINITNEKEITCEELEKHNIQENEIILFKTINSKLYNGINILSEYCTLNDMSAQYIISRRIKTIGIDYLTIEPKHNQNFSVHISLLKNNIPILEGLKLGEVPEGEYTLTALPLKIDDCEASPIRAILTAYC